MKEGERGPFFPKLRVRIKDNNSSPHGKFYRFLFPFSSKFRPKLRPICSLYLPTHSEPGLPVVLHVLAAILMFCVECESMESDVIFGNFKPIGVVILAESSLALSYILE